MYKLCKTEQSAKRQRIIENQLEEMMKKQEFARITVSALCAKIGMPRKSFYCYFDTKEDVVHSLIEHRIKDFDYFETEDFLMQKASTQEILERFFRYWRQQCRLLDGLQRSSLSGLLVELTVQHTIREEKSMQFMRWSNKDWQSQEIIRFCVSGLMSMVLEWHRTSYEKSPVEMAQKAAYILTSPCFRNI